MRWLAAVAAGLTFVALAAAKGERHEPSAVSFVSTSQGWELAREGCTACAVVRRTLDGGKTWSTVSTLPAAWFWGNGRRAPAVSDLAFADPANGFAFDPALLATHDGGRTWHAVDLPVVTSLRVGAGFAFALTEATPRRGGVVDLWRSPVRRDAWRLVGQFAGPTSLAVQGRVVAVLQGGGPLWVSRTSWKRWQIYATPCTPGDGTPAAVGLTRGAPSRWLVDCWDNLQSMQEQHTRHHLYETTNGGRSWRRLGDPAHTGGPEQLMAISTGAMFLAVSGISDELHGSFDGGRTWRLLFRSGGSFFGWADLSFVDDRTGFVVGPTHYSPEHVYRTDDGGRRWRIIDSG